MRCQSGSDDAIVATESSASFLVSCNLSLSPAILPVQTLIVSRSRSTKLTVMVNLPVPAHPGCHGQMVVKWLLCVEVPTGLKLSGRG